MPQLRKFHQPLLACRVAKDAALLAGAVDFVFGPEAELFAGEHPIARPYPGCAVETPDGPHYLMILRDGLLAGRTSLPPLTVRQPGQEDFPILPVRIDEGTERFAAWFAGLPAAARERIFSLLAREMHGGRSHRALCLALHSHTGSRGLALERACWLTPSILYGECAVEGEWLEKRAELLLLSRDRVIWLPARTFQIAERKQAFVAMAEETAYDREFETFRPVFFSGGAVYALKGEASARAYGLDFMEELRARPPHQIARIRETVCRAALRHYRAGKPAHAAGLLGRLQHYAPLPPRQLADGALPFNLYVEETIPIGGEGVFVSGWMRDPLARLTRLEAVSDLGFALDMAGRLHRFPRPDVAEAYRGGPYGGYAEEHGFAAYLPLSAPQRRALEGMAELHGFRFRAETADGAAHDIVPEIHRRDPFAARDFVLRAIPADMADEAALKECIGPAALALQRRCMAQAEVKEIRRFGREMRALPEVSLVIPLYRRLDYIKPQVACFAADPETAECELVYVLDSPEQEREVSGLLKELCALYPALAATLAVMRRNSGYAAASNHGAAAASGETLLFMNSDVLPKEPGWLGTMLRFHGRDRRIGALAPKLLYEDGSIQHAGMTFGLGRFPFWINLHPWKGHPADYPPACIARPMPAVTGACLMVHKALFVKAGGFTTDYVIGDFEDSDLCLKLAEMGYESWYLPEAELYHPERQSMPLNECYRDSHAWRINALLHHARWDKRIAERMRDHERRTPRRKTPDRIALMEAS